MSETDEVKKQFILESSPHSHSSLTTQKAMFGVVIGLVPAMVASVIFFGARAAVLLGVCSVSCVASEALVQRLRKRKMAVMDGSALLTGILLALVLPPALPVYAAIIGSVFAIVIGKQLFGGLGCNIFNPALLGRAFLTGAYPVLLTTWSSPNFADATTSATPLAAMKFSQEGTPLLNLLLGNVSGSLGETSAVALIIGGAFILVFGYADWRIPTGMLGTVFCLGGLAWILGGGKYPSPAFHLLSGGLLIGALFMATDPVTSPVTKAGRWIFGVAAGVLVLLIRLWGGYPEGVMFSVLIMNSVRPLLDRWTIPRTFGQVKLDTKESR